MSADPPPRPAQLRPPARAQAEPAPGGPARRPAAATSSLNLSDPPPPAPLGDLFAPAVREVWLEIGFGGGEHLLWQAEQQPRRRPDRLRAVPGRRRQGAARHRGAEARQCPAARRRRPPAAALAAGGQHPARAFILFPDPWPKKRHQKRRLVSAATLRELARVMRAGRGAAHCHRHRRLCALDSAGGAARRAALPGAREGPTTGGSGRRTGRKPATSRRPSAKAGAAIISACAGDRRCGAVR